MAKTKKFRQINLEMKNRVGLLSEVCSALSAAKVNIKAVCAYGMEKKAYVMLLTSNNTKAKKALVKVKAKITEDDVIAVEMSNHIGQLKKTADRIADAGIDILYMYATAGTGKTSVGVFKTDNDRKALKVL